MLPIHVDFYLLADTTPQARLFLACRLLEKAYLCGHKIFVYCRDIDDTKAIDELLWTFKDDSFIPHNIQGEYENSPASIQIGLAPNIYNHYDLLLNLTSSIPKFYIDFQHIIEIIPNETERLATGRVSYRQYRADGCVMGVHNNLFLHTFLP